MIFEKTDQMKLETLLRENQNIRVELTAVVKNIHYCFFSFLASLGIFAGIIGNMSQQSGLCFYESIYNMGLVTLLISQIEFIIVVFSINLQSDIYVKAAYIDSIEKKSIN